MPPCECQRANAAGAGIEGATKATPAAATGRQGARRSDIPPASAGKPVFQRHPDAVRGESFTGPFRGQTGRGTASRVVKARGICSRRKQPGFLRMVSPRHAGFRGLQFCWGRVVILAGEPLGTRSGKKIFCGRKSRAAPGRSRCRASGQTDRWQLTDRWRLK
jgi:hypothetical protein